MRLSEDEYQMLKAVRSRRDGSSSKMLTVRALYRVLVDEAIANLDAGTISFPKNLSHELPKSKVVDFYSMPCTLEQVQKMDRIRNALGLVYSRSDLIKRLIEREYLAFEPGKM